MKNKLQLKSLVIQNENGEEISISIDGAKELYEQLHRLFKDKEPAYPIVIDYPYKPWWQWYEGPFYTSTKEYKITTSDNSFTIKSPDVSIGYY